MMSKQHYIFNPMIIILVKVMIYSCYNDDLAFQGIEKYYLIVGRQYNRLFRR